MQMMDERENGFLKSKSPKFAKVDIQSDDPELANKLKDKLVDGMTEDEPVDEMSLDKPSFDEPTLKSKTPEEDEDLARLLEMYEKIK